MKIRMLTGMTGVGFSLSRGEETEQFSDKEVERLIKAGYAEEVKGGEPSTSAAPKAKASTKKAAG